MQKKKTGAEKKKRPSGAAHLKAAGKTAILIGLSEDDIAIVDEACEIDGRSRANFVAHYSVLAAEKILARKADGE
jgi:uncharacterized protein (DUF1778 family)